MHSWCVESEKWVEIFFHHWTSQKIPFLYFFLHKSWIWQTLGHVTKKISYRQFHNASKECFWPKNFLNFIKVPFCQFFIFAKMALLNTRIYAGKSTKRRFSLMSNDEKKFQPIFQILHIKNAWVLLELAMALVTTIGMRFLQVCHVNALVEFWLWTLLLGLQIECLRGCYPSLLPLLCILNSECFKRSIEVLFLHRIQVKI